MENEVTGSLAADEKAYFDSRGEAEVKAIPDAAEPEIKDEPETVVDVDAELAEVETIEGDDPPEKPTGQSKVPLAALTKERAKSKASETARIEAEKKAAVLEDRWNMVLASQRQTEETPAPANEPPDPLADPQGAIEWATKQIRDQQEQQKQAAQQTEAQQKAQAEWTEIYTAVATDYNEALAAEPSIKSAHEALLNSQGEEFLAMGLTKDEAQQEITRIEQQHIRYAKQRGIPIGTYILSLAKARGWKPGATQQADDPGKDMDKLAEAVDGSTTLSGASGEAPKTTNAQAIADMSPEQFADWLGKNPGKFRKMAGG